MLAYVVAVAGTKETTYNVRVFLSVAVDINNSISRQIKQIYMYYKNIYSYDESKYIHI
jgi:hypothetical protein